MAQLQSQMLIMKPFAGYWMFGEMWCNIHSAMDVASLEKVAKPWYMIDPRSTAMARWDIITSTALIFTVIMSPVEVAFLPA